MAQGINTDSHRLSYLKRLVIKSLSFSGLSYVVDCILDGSMCCMGTPETLKKYSA